MAENTQTDLKKHAACDECRTRKLKCSGEQPSCQRCQTEGIECVYSPQKKMGRPRKRAREDPTNHDFNSAVFDEAVFDFPSIDPSPMVGIPGTGISLDFPRRDLIDPLNVDNSMAWLDPMLQNTALSDRNVGHIATPNPPGEGYQDDISQSIHPSYPTPPVQADTCNCLPNLYLALSELRTFPRFLFPYHMHKLKMALHVTIGVLDCPICPNEPTSAMQNLMLLTTLLTTITDCYRKLLAHIDVEAARAEAAGETLTFRMGDSSPERWHLHTGTTNCPMGINLDLDPPEYKMLGRKAIKADVYGSAKASADAASIMGITKRLEERQQRWHEAGSSGHFHAHFSQAGRECNSEHGDFTCLKLVSMIKNHVELLGLK